EYLVSVWWNQWDWWTNQPSSQADNALNISIVEGLSEKPVSDVSYTLNVSSNGNSMIDQESIYDGGDTFNLSLTDTDLIEVVFSDMGAVDESLKFKFKIDSDSNSN
ncbi:MAG: hypothetical protein QMC47_03505, partial [Nitrosopumilus sp.]